MSRGPSHDRRRFLKLLGLAGLTSAVNSTMLAWSEARPAAAAARPSTPPAPPAVEADSTAGEKPPEISDDARALAGILKRRHGKHLDAGQLEAVARDLDYQLRSGKRLREFRLENHEEPDFIFRAS